jgi:hypothetical protein
MMSAQPIMWAGRALRPGTKYRFVHERNRTTAFVTIARLIAYEDGNYVLDMRPDGGTAKLPGRWVRDITPVAADARIVGAEVIRLAEPK